MKVYIYCTKAKPYLYYGGGIYGVDDYQWRVDNKPLNKRKWASSKDMNGEIVASFDLNNVEEIYYLSWMNEKLRERILKGSCLTDIQLNDYMNGKDTFYAWHIDNLEILDKPLKLSDFHHSDSLKTFSRAPQSWCYAELVSYEPEGNGIHIKNEECVLISIKPEYAAKILNGEKTIEIRKTAPKEVLENDK